MNEQTRTLTFAGVAVVAALAAFGAWQANQPSTVDGFSEVGEEFFPDFADAASATELTVVDYDKDTREPITFSVKKNDDGLWTIPSHHDYPAEAEDRLARTATSLLNVEKTAVQSRSKEDWKRYGVVGPATEETATDKQRGQRLTLKDSSGNPLVDLIVGNEVEDNSGHYYVREPEENTTYVTELNVDLSAKFSDWIEPDLLKLSSSDLVKVILDNYSIDEQRGAILKKDLLEFKKEGLETTGTWTLVGLDADTEELDTSPISSIATNLDQLKIVGVRPKPEGLEDDLQIHPAFKQMLQAQMQEQGYFIGPGKDGKGEQLYSNEGELIAGTNKGVQYTLYFGEIARGTGQDIEVGLQQDAEGDSPAEEDSDNQDDESSDDEEEGPRRYLLVKVDLNKDLLGDKPQAPVEPKKPEILQEESQEKDPPSTEADDAEQPEAADKPESADAAAETEATTEENGADPAKAAADEEQSCGPFDEESSDETVAAEETTTPDEAATEAENAESPAAEKSAETTASEETAVEETEKDSNDAAAPSESQPQKKETPAANAESADEPTEADAKSAPEAAKSDEAEKTEPPAEPKKSPKQLAQEQHDQAMAEYRSAKTQYETDLKAWEQKLEDGQEKVDELKRRFDGWYYVISSDSFEKFRIERKDVISAKEDKEETSDAAQPALQP